ncbi:stress response rci peptide protein [Rutstroemia sp. NJR-2017a WRK4]|nr:stress response rci peptide protein [Rutstroemia sp. NJR-2017a WRK4]
MCSSDIFLGLIAILFPPVAVWVKRGICSVDSIINILLCMLGFLPGLLHAWYIIAKFPEHDYDYIPDSEARVTYVVVQEPGLRNQRMPKNGAGPGPQQQGTTGYGATTAPTVQQQQNGTWATAGEGSSNAVPPTYEQAVRGDHKVQTHD